MSSVGIYYCFDAAIINNGRVGSVGVHKCLDTAAADKGRMGPVRIYDRSDATGSDHCGMSSVRVHYCFHTTVVDDCGNSSVRIYYDLLRIGPGYEKSSYHKKKKSFHLLRSLLYKFKRNPGNLPMQGTPGCFEIRFRNRSLVAGRKQSAFQLGKTDKSGDPKQGLNRNGHYDGLLVLQVRDDSATQVSSQQ